MSLKGRHARRPPGGSGGRSGYLSALLLGLLFLSAGVAAVVDPRVFWSAGGTGPYAESPVTTVFGAEGSVVMGFVFIGISLLFLAVAWRIFKGDSGI